MRVLAPKICFVLTLSTLLQFTTVSAQDNYFPGRWGTWETRSAAESGMDESRLNEAVEFAKSQANTDSKDLKQIVATSFANEPFNTIVGPTKTRGEANGIVIRDGYIVAEWGDTKRVDMTFSVTKSYLSTVAGLALDGQLIRDVNAPMKDYVRDGKFESDHNSKITWQHLLHQTSDWSGELWGKPDWCDRPVGRNRRKWVDREIHKPGSFFKYNDVRVNLLAFALTNVFRKPLPVVLREKIMDPIGASPTWRWHGYENSWITLDGQKVQCVSGGGHWGGGMFICTRDHARFGYLFLREGNWNGKQLISKQWIKNLQKPSGANPTYGNMWWLNTEQKRIPGAPESIYYAAGFGGNYIYVDRENDLLIVLRWTPDVAGVVKKFVDAIETKD